MMQLITPDRYAEFADDLTEMHRLRYRVFKERLDWAVEVRGVKEIDAFDTLHPAYLLQRSRCGHIQGCVRLLPSTGPTMLRDTFSVLLAGHPAPGSPGVWESSRFALDLPASAPKAAGGLAQATYELFVGMIEFGLSQHLDRIVTVTDLRMERILRRAAWPLDRIGVPHPIGNTKAVAGFLEVSRASLMRIRTNGRLKGPVLWAPVLEAIA